MINSKIKCSVYYRTEKIHWLNNKKEKKKNKKVIDPKNFIPTVT